MSIIPQFFLEATVALGINNPDNVFWSATGFIAGRFEGEIDGNKKYTTYLITNKHVVTGHDNMSMQVNGSDRAKTYNLEMISNGELNYSCHSAPNIDVIAKFININAAKAEGSQMAFFELDEHSLTLSQMKATGVCEGSLIYTLGFPTGIAGGFINDTVKAPVCRFGCISRIEDVYHSSESSFIIDAMTFPGNSGSPVICRPETVSIGTTPCNPKADLIGIVSGHLPYCETLCSTQTNRPRVINEDNSGLSIVISVDCIKEVIELERARIYGLASDDELPEITELRKEAMEVTV